MTAHYATRFPNGVIVMVSNDPNFRFLPGDVVLLLTDGAVVTLGEGLCHDLESCTRRVDFSATSSETIRGDAVRATRRGRLHQSPVIPSHPPRFYIISHPPLYRYTPRLGDPIVGVVEKLHSNHYDINIDAPTTQSYHHQSTRPANEHFAAQFFRQTLRNARGADDGNEREGRERAEGKRNIEAAARDLPHITSLKEGHESHWIARTEKFHSRTSDSVHSQDFAKPDSSSSGDDDSNNNSGTCAEGCDARNGGNDEPVPNALGDENDDADRRKRKKRRAAMGQKRRKKRQKPSQSSSSKGFRYIPQAEMKFSQVNHVEIPRAMELGSKIHAYDFYRNRHGVVRVGPNPNHITGTLDVLGFDGATKGSRPRLSVGEVVFAHVSHVDLPNGILELSCRAVGGGAKGWMTGESLWGALGDGGMLVDTPTAYAAALLTAEAPVLMELGERVSFEACVGMNGRVWIRSFARQHALQHTIAIAQCIEGAVGDRTPEDVAVRVEKYFGPQTT